MCPYPRHAITILRLDSAAIARSLIHSLFPMTPVNRFHTRTNTIVNSPAGTGFGKNLPDVKILGLCHYRKVFFFSTTNGFLFVRRRRKRYFHPTLDNFKYITAPERTAFVEKLLSKYDVIVPRRIPLGESLSLHYVSCHVQRRLGSFHSRHKNFLSPVLSRNKLVRQNVLYTPVQHDDCTQRRLFDRYMSALFPLLFWMEEKKVVPLRSVSMPGSRVSIREIFYLSTYMSPEPVAQGDADCDFQKPQPSEPVAGTA